MKIRLERLSLRNFKGIRELDIHFDDQTVICGANGTGKTTIVDAFRWLLFGKDSSNASVFSIKTMTPDGEAVHELEHEVEADLLIDNGVGPIKITVKKIYKEDWRTRRGEAVPYLAGHTNTYFWNGVPLSEKDYKASVAELIEEEMFKLITDPQYFNNDLTPARRRYLLINMGGITDQDVVATNGDFQAIIDLLTTSKTIEGLKAQAAAAKKKIKDEKMLIPARIDELKRSKPVAQDWDELHQLHHEYRQKVEAIDKQLLDKSQRLTAWQEKKMDIQRAVIRAENRMENIQETITAEVLRGQRKLKDAITEKRQRFEHLTTRVANLNVDIELDQKRIADFEAAREDLVAAFEKAKSLTLEIDPNELMCPTCHRELDALDIETKRETMQRNFNQKKLDDLEAINKRGQDIKQLLEHNRATVQRRMGEREDLSLQRDAAEAALRDLESQMAEAPSADSLVTEKLGASLEYDEAKQALFAAQNDLKAYPPFEADEDTASLQAEKKAILEKMQTIQGELANEEVIARTERRIADLEAQEKAMAAEIADLERTEFLALEFSKAKMRMVDERINGMFRNVTFRMFKTNLNGGEEECCDTLINGVPWSDANNAAKINAGMDIIRALNRYYDIAAPIFIDNAEAINEIDDIGTQTVELRVTLDPVLYINGIAIKEPALA